MSCAVSGLDLLFSFTIFDEDYTEKLRIDQIKVKGERIFVNLASKFIVCESVSEILPFSTSF